jgi:hypothetical protein
MIPRVVVVVALLAIAGFGVFGFLATFEPMESQTQITWRAVYAVGTLASLAAAICIALTRKKGP